MDKENQNEPSTVDEILRKIKKNQTPESTSTAENQNTLRRFRQTSIAFSLNAKTLILQQSNLI